MSWLDDFLLAIKRVRNAAGENMPQRTALQFGSGFTLTDDPLTNATLVEGGGGGGGATGPTGPTGPAGATGATGAAGVAGQLPSGWAELPGSVGFSPGPTLILSAQVTTETTANVWAAVSISWQTTLASSGAAFFVTLSNGINTYTSDETWSDATAADDDVAVSLNFRTPVPVAAGTWTARVYGRRTKSLSSLVCTHCDLTVLGMQGAIGPTGATGPAGATGATGPAGDIAGGDVTLTGGLATVVGLQGSPVPIVTTPDGNGKVLVYTAGEYTARLPITGGDVTQDTAGLCTVVGLQETPLDTTAPTAGQVLTFDGASWTPQDASSITSGDVTVASGVATVVGLQGRAIDPIAPTGGQMLVWANASASWEPTSLGGDLSGTPDVATVAKLQGYPVSSGAPPFNSFLRFDGSRWEPGNATYIASGDVAVAGTVATVTGLQGYPMSAGLPAAGSFLAWDDGAAEWTPYAVFAPGNDSDLTYVPGTSLRVSAIQGRAVDPIAPTGGQMLVWANASSSWEPTSLGGDLSGTPDVATVARLQGRALASTAPTTGQSIVWSGTQWEPRAAIVSGDVTVTTVGQAAVVALQGRAMASTAPTTGQVIRWDGTQWAPATPASGITSGDVTVVSGAATVVGLQGRAIDPVMPTGGQMLVYANASASWEPTSLGGDLSGTPDVATVARLQGRALASTAPTTGQSIVWSGTQWEPRAAIVSGDVTVTTVGQASVVALRGRAMASTAPTTGQVISWDGTQWAPATPASGITSGDVTVVSGAATVVGLQGRAIDPVMPTGGQMLVYANASASWEPTSLGGDLSGTPDVATVARLQGRALASTAPTTGQSIVWSGTQWEPRAAIVSGDVTVTTVGQAAVVALQGRALASTAPTTGQVIRWDGTQWAPFEPVTMVFSAQIDMRVAANTLLGTTRSDRGRFVATECWSHIDDIVSPGVTPPTISVGYVAGTGYYEFVALQSLPNSSIVDNYYSQVSLRAAGTTRLSAAPSTGIYCRVATASNATTYVATIILRGFYLTNP